MKYLLLIYGDEKVWASRDEREQQENHERHGRFMQMLRSRNAALGGQELSGSAAATTIRHEGDRVSVTDGPYAETAEQIGGYYVIDAADLDEAIELARQVPEPIVEIRPIVEQPDMAP
jgi:hypothetical protein